MAQSSPYAAPDAPPSSKGIKRMSQLVRLLAMLKPHRIRFWIAVVALLVGSGLSLVYPQAARRAVDLGMAEQSMDSLNEVILILSLVFVLHGVLIWIRHYLMSWLGERVVADLRGQVFDRVLGLPLTWFHDQRSGELVGRLASDVTVVEGVVGSDVSIALRNGVQLIGGLVLLFIVNWQLTLWMLGVVPPLVVGSMYFGRSIRRMSRKVQDRLAEASGHVQESIGAIQTVQAFVHEGLDAAKCRSGVEAAFQESISLARWRSSFFSVVSMAGYVAIAFVIWMGGREVVRGRLSAGDLTAFLLYTFMIAGALAGLGTLWGALQRAAGATERLFGIIDTVPEIRTPDKAVGLPNHGGHVVFDKVDFAYPSRPDQAVLRQVSMDIKPGEVVALVGRSGAGKSTITALLFRFYDVNGGSVRYEGVDVRELDLAGLRKSMAIVSQDPVLFSGSIRENIAYGCDGASEEQIVAAAKDAHAHEFIVRFTEGYDTAIGERGVKLSGGQRQRLAIARAILANPRVLVLDEATSNLDAESEAFVQEALARLMAQRTTIVIAHRLSTVRDADRILVVDDHTIAAEGPHDELLAKSPLYARLVEHQLL